MTALALPTQSRHHFSQPPLILQISRTMESRLGLPPTRISTLLRLKNHIPCEALHIALTHSLLVFELQTLEDIMALESEYFPEQTCRLSSLSPEARRAYKKILWGLFGFYTAAIVTMGVVVVENTNFQKAANVVMTGLWPR